MLSTVLKPNLVANSQSSDSTSNEANPTVPHILECKELDWTVPIASWRWDDPDAIAQDSRDTLREEKEGIGRPSKSRSLTLKPPYDLIVTADTIYTPTLITPLLRSLHHLSRLSVVQGVKRTCPIYLALERRDPQLVDRALEECRSMWGFEVERIKTNKIKRALERAGVSWGEEKTLWEGVEIWKMRLSNEVVAPDSLHPENAVG